MRPGPLIRRAFGPYEHWVTEAYRRFFVDLDDFTKLMGSWVPQAHRILEVGCGEGAMTERITRAYPSAHVAAIDITPRLGRLFHGRTSNVTFSKEFVEDVARREPASFDLVVIVDVLHHVPVGARRSLMGAVDQAMKPGGSLLLKDWVMSSSPVHWLCDASDRYLSGDAGSYFTPDSINALVADTFGPGAVRRVGTVRPWKNNLAVLVQRSSEPPSEVAGVQ